MATTARLSDLVISTRYPNPLRDGANGLLKSSLGELALLNLAEIGHNITDLALASANPGSMGISIHCRVLDRRGQ